MPQEQAWNLALVNRREWVPCTDNEREYWLGTVPPARIEKYAFLVGEPRANTLGGKAVYLMAARHNEAHFVSYATLDEFDNGLIWPKKPFPDLVIPQWEYFIKRGPNYRYAPSNWRANGEFYWLRTVQSYWYAFATNVEGIDRMLNKSPIRDFDEAAIVVFKEMQRALVPVAA
jgi:hypothetical protein